MIRRSTAINVYYISVIDYGDVAIFYEDSTMIYRNKLIEQYIVTITSISTANSICRPKKLVTLLRGLYITQPYQFMGVFKIVLKSTIQYSGLIPIDSASVELINIIPEACAKL